MFDLRVLPPAWQFAQPRGCANCLVLVPYDHGDSPMSQKHGGSKGKEVFFKDRTHANRGKVYDRRGKR